jgi:hypothetical protein
MPISSKDPRLQKCGFAKLQGEDVEFYFKKYEIILGRRSKSTALDVVLGENMNISRQHAVIRYSFETKAWELVVQGKNGVTVNGNLFTPQSQPTTLHSQDLMQVGDRSFYFLLPRGPRKKARRRTPSVQPPQPAAAAATGTGGPALNLAGPHNGNAATFNHGLNSQQQQQYQGVRSYTPTPEAGTPYSEAGQTPGYSEPPDNGYTPGYQQQPQQHLTPGGYREQHGYSQQEEDAEEEDEEDYDQQEDDMGDEDDQDDGDEGNQGQGYHMEQNGGGGYMGQPGQLLQQSYPNSNGGHIF